MIKKHFPCWTSYGLVLGLAALSFSARAQTIPNAPANLTASAPSAFQIRLSWTDAATDEDGFKVERSLDGITFTQVAQVLANTTNYLNTGLFPGSEYFFRVRAYNSAGNSAYASTTSAGTPTPSCPFSVVGWGNNSDGQLTPPPGLSNLVAIATGYVHSLALKSDGTVVGWGNSFFATPPAGLSNVVAIAAGLFHSLALKNDGTVVGWGDGSFGRLPPPAGLNNVAAVAAGYEHSLALKSDGTVVAWGDNTFGQTNVPAGLNGVVAVAAGFYHSVALKSDGTVVAWGDNTYNQTNVPAGLSNVVAICAGYYHSLALKANGNLAGWGYNGYGEASQPAGLAGVVAISAGYLHSLALKSDGTVFGWGNSAYGETTPPPGLAGVAAIAMNYHSLALAVSPGPPSALTTTVMGPNEINLAWTEHSSGVEGFQIERAPDAGGIPGTWVQIDTVDAFTTVYSDATVAANTPYWYRVRALNSCNNSPYAMARVVLDILDDTWLSGTRNVQNPPSSSAWFTSSAGSLNTAPGAMTLTVGGSVLALTYFTPTNTSPPVALNVGDTLTASISLTFNGLPTVPSSSQGFRIGLFDFADGNNSPKRAGSDGFSSSSQGSSVAGYSLFQKMYTSFSDATPMAIRKRTNLSSGSLLGTSGDFTTLASGGDTNAFTGFANLTPYILQIVLARTSLSSMDITMTWSNRVTGAILTVATTDNAATNFNFDGIAFRPQSSSQAAVSNVFTEVKIALTSAPQAPAIVTQPQNVNISSGQNAMFTVAPNGTLPLSYQWYHNTNTPVANATNATLTLTSVQAADAGGYFVIITNSYGSITSAVAALTVNTPPSISTQPAGQTVIPGQNAAFNVVAAGSQPLYYQWFYNTNTPLAGATSPTLILTNVQPGNAGSYSVVVSNATASVTSSDATLTVNTNPVAPVFILQPVSVTTGEGDDATFTATAIGTQPIAYQWNLNGTPVPNAASNTLNLTGIQLSDGGNYTVIATNSIGATTSSVALLIVVPIVPPLPVIPTNEFPITNYGAIGDGITDNTTAIQNTINAASAAGGGTVVVPLGGAANTYLCGPIALASSINLRINSGAMLQMLPYGTWPGTSTFINGVGLHDVAISGPGTIDGQGADWWTAYEADHNTGRPNFINFSGCINVLLQDVMLQNAPTFHMMLKGNNVNLTIQGVTVNAPGNSPNTDGMDLASVHVLIKDCSISVGDDNIEIGGSGGPAADVTVTNCAFGTGHGVSIGSITSGGVSNLTVFNCTFNGTDNGIRMKSDNDRGGLIQNLKYCNLTMTNVGYPIIIYSYYNTFGVPSFITPQIARNQPGAPVNATTPIWRNIVISNMTATATAGFTIAGIIWGRSEMLVSNLALYNVTIAAPTKTFDIYNTRGIRIVDSPLTAPNAANNTLRLYNAQVTVTNSVPGASLVTLGGLSVPPTNNSLAFYNTLAAITDTGLLGSSPITLGGSTLAFAQDSVTFANNLNIVSASTLAMTSGNNSYNGAFLGSGPLALSLPGGSSLTLQGDSSAFSGSLTASNNGTLLVNNTTGSGTGSGAVTVMGPATLGGNGVIGGPLTVNGTLAPGNSPGTLTVNNDLVINNGAVLQYQLGTSSDLAVVNGNLTLDGTLNISNAGGLGANNYPLFAYTGSLSGNTTLGATPPGYSYYVNTNTAGQVVLIAYSPAPMPPGFATISSSGGNLVLSGGAGSTNGPYYVLTSTNLALPRNQWTRSAVGQFDGNGNFTFTNAPGTNAPRQFYLLQLP